MSDRPVTLITGSSKGIGWGLAENFLKQGHQVVGCSRRPFDPGHELYHHTEVDVGDEKQVRDWIRSVRSKFQKIDNLVCNAGLVRSALLTAITPGDVLESFLRTNVAGVFYVLREVSKVMVMHGYGRIVTISSILTAMHEEGTAAYSASKSAATEMTKVLAKELAPRGIVCNIVAPSMTMTGPAMALSEGGDWQKRMLDKQTIKRPVTTDELFHVVSFLTSPQSGCVTGQTIHLGLVT